MLGTYIILWRNTTLCFDNNMLASRHIWAMNDCRIKIVLYHRSSNSARPKPAGLQESIALYFFISTIPINRSASQNNKLRLISLIWSETTISFQSVLGFCRLFFCAFLATTAAFMDSSVTSSNVSSDLKVSSVLSLQYYCWPMPFHNIFVALCALRLESLSNSVLELFSDDDITTLLSA